MLGKIKHGAFTRCYSDYIHDIAQDIMAIVIIRDLTHHHANGAQDCSSEVLSTHGIDFTAFLPEIVTYEIRYCIE